jgi:hypothetical protein
MTKTPLDIKRIVEPTIEPCRSGFSRLFDSVNILTGERSEINCKSWRCPRHRVKWGRKWGSIINWQLEKTPCNLLVNLTTAEMVDHTVIEAAMRYFMRRWRCRFGRTEYVKCCEYNCRKTQPHFHLLLICPRLLVADMPADWPPDKSWPEPVWELICEMWGKALEFASPGSKYTEVTWCQPPKVDKGKASAFYAIGYITGKNKDEEPDSTWHGRKLTYSKGFFQQTTAEIWRQLLEKWFGPPEPARFFWVPKADLDFSKLLQDEYSFIIPAMALPGPLEKKGDEKLFELLRHIPIMAQRFREAIFYRRNQAFPVEPTRFSQTVVYEVTLEGQEFFDTQ